MTEGTLKRKKPPTFQHLPLNRAKKLKQTWVENTKIKSKWKAQKRKEGLVPAPAHKDEDASAGGSSDAEQSGEASESDAEEVGQEEEPAPAEKPPPKKSSLHPSRAHIHPELAPAKPQKRRRTDEKVESTPEAPPSVRDLTREAYSRSSLHTFKAGRGRGMGARGGARGRGRGRGRGAGKGPGETGRGQPNMHLRMTAMLEQIKQDFT